jgi:RNA polymerase sigma factor (sigma-70 family)
MAIAHIDRLLQKAQSELSSLKNYAKIVFSNAITDRMRCVDKSVGHSDWSLLIRTSETCLKTSLKTSGYLAAPIDSYLLAWDCFKEIYASDRTKIKQQLSAPNSETWEQISRLYNQLRQPTDPESNATAIAQWLQSATRAIRQSLAPPIISLNQPISTNDSGELQDILPNNDEEAIEQSINYDTREQINIILLDVLDRITQESQQTPANKKTETAEEILKVLPLVYRQGLSETEIGKLLGINQSTVSRRRKLVRENMLKSLCEWAEITLHISIDSHIINHMNHLIEDWLEQYFTN